MNLLLLPGNSSRHALWVEELKTALSPHFSNIQTQHYRHWQTREEFADIQHEITVAKAQEETIKPYTIIAKSIGSVIAVNGVSTGSLHPEKLVLLGVPINGGVSVESFAGWLRGVDVPVVIAQNTADPLGSYNDVKVAFEQSGGHLSFVELPGTTHDYLDFAAIKGLI